MMKFILLVLLSCFLFSNFLQSDDLNEQIIKEANYYKLLEQNAFKDSINGVYIPKDLYEAMDMLDTMFNEESKKEISQLINAAETIQYHLGSGMGIRNRWGLWVNSRLATILKN